MVEEIINNDRQLVIFKLGEEEFGMEINEVREIIPIKDITEIPDTTDYVQGIIKLREKIIVVIDLEKKLQLLPSIENEKDKRIIVVDIENEMVGLIVDSCNEVLHIRSDQIEQAPRAIKSKIHKDYLKSVGIINDRLIIMLNIKNLLGDKIIDTIKEMNS